MPGRGSFAQDLKRVTWEQQQWQIQCLKWTLGPASAEIEPLQLLQWTLRGWRVIADALWQCGGVSGKELTCQCWRHKTWVHSQGWEDPLEEGMATHFSILAQRTPWTEEPDELQSIVSQRVRHDWSDLAHMHAQWEGTRIALLKWPYILGIKF